MHTSRASVATAQKENLVSISPVETERRGMKQHDAKHRIMCKGQKKSLGHRT